MRIGIKEIFSAAHRLQDHTGRCSQLHGHTYTVEVEVDGALTEKGWVIDFGELRAIVRKLLPDHIAILQTKDAVATELEKLNFGVKRTIHPPTAEIIVLDLVTQLQRVLIVDLARVRVWEGPNSWAEWIR